MEYLCIHFAFIHPLLLPSKSMLLNLLNVEIINAVRCVVMTPAIDLFSLLLCNCNFAAVRNHTMNIYVFRWL